MKIGIRPLITLHFFLASVALTTYSLIIGKQRIEKREAGEDVVYITGYRTPSVRAPLSISTLFRKNSVLVRQPISTPS